MIRMLYIGVAGFALLGLSACGPGLPQSGTGLDGRPMMAGEMIPAAQPESQRTTRTQTASVSERRTSESGCVINTERLALDTLAAGVGLAISGNNSQFARQRAARDATAAIRNPECGRRTESTSDTVRRTTRW